MSAPAHPSLHRVELGRTVRRLREHRGMTVRALARHLGVSIGTVSAIENALVGVSSERVVHLADALGVGPGLLLHGVAEPIRDVRWADAAGARGEPSAEDWRHYAPLDLDPALRGALASFLEVGYHGSTMRGIAERANLSVAGLYHYYASKQQLLVTLLEHTMAELQGRTTAASAEGAEAWDRFALLVECQALFHSHRRELGFIGATEMRSLSRPARDRIARVRREEQERIDVEVLAACEAGVFGTSRPREAARAVVTMCTAIPQWYRHGGAATPEQVARWYVDFAIDLVRCDSAHRPA